MDKQQAAREVEFRKWLPLQNGNVGQESFEPWSEGFNSAWQAAQAALMPLLVEARDCTQEIIAYANAHSQRSENGVSFHPIASTLLVNLGDALARINAIIGDKK